MESALLEPAVDYRRIARRVRCRLGNDPIGKQQALAALARRADRARPAIRSPEPDTAVRAFAAAISTAMEGPILRFSRRQELIRQAEGLGIRRFDANLLIAAVQHRLGGEKRIAGGTANREPVWRLAIPIGFAIAIQGAIVLSFWHLFV